MRTPLVLLSLAAAPLLMFGACSNGSVTPIKDGGSDGKSVADAVIAEVAPTPHDGALPATYCELPGSLRFSAGGVKTVVTGGENAAPSLDWLTLPDGFCAHYFAHVQTTRQLRFAPGGELFVASPSTPTAGGAPSGLGGIVVLFDDNGDGYADGDVFPHSDMSAQSLNFFTNIASVQGLMFTPGFFYFQNDTQIMKIAYATGQRVIMGTPDSVVDLSVANNDYVSSVHWPKTLDISDDGTIYVGNGGDQSEACNASTFPGAFAQLFQGGGGVFKIDGTPGGNPVAAGFRNPIAVRCQKGHNLCFATELALDGSAASGGREKLIPIRQGDDWGFPCCATANAPYGEVTGSPNCASVAAEPVSFIIGDTPFGLDFETGVWPAPYTNDILVTLHGAVGSWIGARVIAIPTLVNGMPAPSSDLGSSTFTNLATGWDDGLLDHGRPAAISFSADGRAFVANDIDGDIFWIAPTSLKTKS